MEVKSKRMSLIDRFRATESRNELSSRYINSAADIKSMLNPVDSETLKANLSAEFKRLMEARMASTHEPTYESKASVRGFFGSDSAKYDTSDFFSVGEVASYEKSKPKANADKPQTDIEPIWA